MNQSTTRQIVSSIAGILLCVSAAGKFFNLPVFAVIIDSIFNLGTNPSIVLSVFATAIEISIGLTLIIYPFSLFSEMLGSLIYAAFSLTQIFIIFSNNNTDCGCFGVFQGKLLAALTRNHWAMFTLDATFALMLGTKNPHLLVKKLN